MPSTSELSPIATQYGQTGVSSTGEPARVGIQPLDIVKRQWKSALSVGLVVFLLGYVYLSLSMVPVYQATAIVYVSPVFPTALADNQNHEGNYDQFLEQQITSATRYETLQKALRQMPEAWPAFSPNEPEQSRIQRLQNAMKVEQIGHSYEVAISVDSFTPKLLPEFVNLIAATYVSDAREGEVYGREQKLATLLQEKKDQKAELDADMAKQGEINNSVGMARYDGAGANPYDDHLGKLREELVDAHQKSAEADADLNGLGSGNLQSPAMQQAASEEVNQDSAVSALKAQLSARKAVLMVEIIGIKPTTAQYKTNEIEIAEVDQRLEQISQDAIRKASSRIRQRALSAKTRARALESQISADLSRTTAQASSAAPKLQQAQVLSDDIARILGSQAIIANRIQGLELEGDSPGSVRLFSAALPPEGPLKRKTQIAFAALLFVSLVCGALTAMIIDSLDPHVYTSRDIRRLVGFPPIGLLLDPKEFSPTLQREYFLRLAGGLDQAHRRTGARTFVFPSIGPTSSRSIVEQLGVELAGSGLRVLVVHVQSQAAVEKPRPAIDATLVPVPNPRLLSMTEGQSALSTDVDKEQYRMVSLPASEVTDLLRRSRSFYNAILVAADPLFTSAYTEHFARTADGTVLIVESGATRKDELIRAARLLERLKIAGIAIVLNGVSEKRAEDDLAQTLADYKKAAA